MSAAWVPPRPFYHLRLFVISLVLVVVCLAGFLFGVHMEAVVPATGAVTARDLQEIRAPRPGLIEAGWFEGELPQPGGLPLRVRADSQGNAVAGPDQGMVRALQVSPRDLHFHALRCGDEVWGGQVLAVIHDDNIETKLQELANLLQQGIGDARRSADLDQLRGERDRLRDQILLRVPASADHWLAVTVSVARLQGVQPGDVIATIVPIDPQTRQPRDLIARLDVEEKHFGDIRPGQAVRIYSTMYNHRLHGCAEACIERLEPWGESATEGHRRFHANASVTAAAFPLPLGSTFKAEVIIGRKPVYRIILEQ